MARTAFSAALAALSLLVACSDDGGGGGTQTETGTTADQGTTGTTVIPDGTTTDATPTTTVDPTTGDPTTGEPDPTGELTTAGTTDGETGTTGPICDPGTANCVCDAGTCQDDLTCEDGVCVSQVACDADITEPDDVEGEAQDLGSITDDDDEKLMADGFLSGASDVDWYRYTGEDTFGHTAEPTILLTGKAGIRVCQFFECVEGGPAQTAATCPEGTKFAISGDLRPGCCGGNQFTVTEFNCPQTSDDLHVFVRLDKSELDECVDYSLSLHF